MSTASGKRKVSVWLAGRMETGVARDSMFRVHLGPDYPNIIISNNEVLPLRAHEAVTPHTTEVLPRS